MGMDWFVGRRNRFEHSEDGFRKLIKACVEIDKDGRQENLKRVVRVILQSMAKTSFYSNSLKRTSFVEARKIPLKKNDNPLNIENGFWSTSK